MQSTDGPNAKFLGMTPEERDQTIAKIKKLINLGGSSNSHEAALAIQCARDMMKKYGIDEALIEAADYGQAKVYADNGGKRASWNSKVGAIVAMVFGCKCIIHGERDDSEGSYISFFGPKYQVDICKYCYDVILAALDKSLEERKAQIEIRRKNLQTEWTKDGQHWQHWHEIYLNKVAPKLSRSDVFAFKQGWLDAVNYEVQGMARKRVLNEDWILASRWPKLFSPETKLRNIGGNTEAPDSEEYHKGLKAGSEFQLLNPVTGKDGTPLLANSVLSIE